MMLQHPEVRYEVTDFCNAHCIMCPRELHTREHGVMDLAAYERSIDEVTELGAKRIVLTGFGEPLLDPSLDLKIKYAADKGLHTYIITNASALTVNNGRRLLESGLDEIRISFYGMQKDTYETVMCKLNFERTFANVLCFVDTVKDESIKIHLSYLELPENKCDTQDFIEFWEGKVHAIDVWRPHNFGDGKNYRDRAGGKKTCGRPMNGPLQIQWNGDVVPCCYDYNNQILLGNVFKDSVVDVLYGKKYNALRDAHSKGEFHKFPYCNQCDQLLEHSDALIYTNRHALTSKEAVKLSNTDLYNLIDNHDMDKELLNENYKQRTTLYK